VFKSELPYVTYVPLFDFSDLRTNLFEEGENDVNPESVQDLFVLPRRTTIKVQAKRFQMHIGVHIQGFFSMKWSEEVLGKMLEEANLKPKFKSLLKFGPDSLVLGKTNTSRTRCTPSRARSMSGELLEC